MSNEDSYAVFTICGQKFRLRAEGSARERMEQVAQSVDELIRERRSSGANSEVRAAIMAAFELAFELSDLRDEMDRAKPTVAVKTMDRLLNEIDREIGTDGSTRKK